MKKDKRETPSRGSVRIIGGRWRRRRIVLPAHEDLRPTPDRVRETLFNWLMPVLPGAVCLDLFAGSGVLGFEALSRGARRVVLVDQSAASAGALARLRETLADDLENELDASAEIVCARALDYLPRAGIGPFDVVFVDPPYVQPAEPILRALLPSLRPSARIYLERDRGDAWPELEALEWVRKATAGGVAFGLAEFRAGPRT
jgi:16S rRNA (guanine966-N2)-methyltransferase